MSLCHIVSFCLNHAVGGKTIKLFVRVGIKQWYDPWFWDKKMHANLFVPGAKIQAGCIVSLSNVPSTGTFTFKEGIWRHPFDIFWYLLHRSRISECLAWCWNSPGPCHWLEQHGQRSWQAFYFSFSDSDGPLSPLACLRALVPSHGWHCLSMFIHLNLPNVPRSFWTFALPFRLPRSGVARSGVGSAWKHRGSSNWRKNWEQGLCIEHILSHTQQVATLILILISYLYLWLKTKIKQSIKASWKVKNVKQSSSLNCLGRLLRPRGFDFQTFLSIASRDFNKGFNKYQGIREGIFHQVMDYVIKEIQRTHFRHVCHVCSKRRESLWRPDSWAAFSKASAKASVLIHL